MCRFTRYWKLHSGFLWIPRCIIEWDLVLLDRMISEKEKVMSLCTTKYTTSENCPRFSLSAASDDLKYCEEVLESGKWDLKHNLTSFYLICCLLRRWKYCAAVVGCTTSQFTLSPSALLTGLRFYIMWLKNTTLSSKTKKCTKPRRNYLRRVNMDQFKIDGGEFWRNRENGNIYNRKVLSAFFPWRVDFYADSEAFNVFKTNFLRMKIYIHGFCYSGSRSTVASKIFGTPKCIGTILCHRGRALEQNFFLQVL